MKEENREESFHRPMEFITYSCVRKSEVKEVQIITVVIPCISDVQSSLRREGQFLHIWKGSAAYHSEACQESRIEAARIASELSIENLPIAACNPFSATPRW